MSHLLVLSPALAPTPANFMAHLRINGWRSGETGEAWAVFDKQIEGNEVAIEVPLLGEAPDYRRLAEELLRDLGKVERRAEGTIAHDVQASGNDLVRLGLRGLAFGDGRLPAESAGRVYERARDLLLAAACAALEPRAVYAKRKPEAAMDYLRVAMFAPAEVGSCVLSIEAAVPPKLQESLNLGDDPEPPFVRKVHVTLARALEATRIAASQTAASGKLEPFLEQTRHGVSANLCDALAGILDESRAESIAASIHFAPVRPVPADVPRRIDFGRDAAVILKEVATSLRERSPMPDTELVGIVRKLDSANPSQGGLATIAVELEGRLRLVHVNLTAEDYQTAVSAHAERRLARVVGELLRVSRDWKLQNPRGFVVVAEE